MPCMHMHAGRPGSVRTCRVGPRQGERTGLLGLPGEITGSDHTCSAHAMGTHPTPHGQTFSHIFKCKNGGECRAGAFYKMNKGAGVFPPSSLPSISVSWPGTLGSRGLAKGSGQSGTPRSHPLLRLCAEAHPVRLRSRISSYFNDEPRYGSIGSIQNAAPYSWYPSRWHLILGPF